MRELPQPPLSGWQLAAIRVVAAVGGVVLMVLGFFFSIFVISVLLVLGTVFGSWWWWRTRDLRRALREQRAHQASWPRDLREDASIIEGEIIEGEVVRDDDPKPPLPG